MFRPDASPASEPRSKRVTRAPRFASSYAIVVPAIPPPTTPISLTAIDAACRATPASSTHFSPPCPHLGEKRGADPNMLLDSRPGEAIRQYPRLEESRFARVPHHLRGRCSG